MGFRRFPPFAAPVMLREEQAAGCQVRCYRIPDHQTVQGDSPTLAVVSGQIACVPHAERPWQPGGLFRQAGGCCHVSEAPSPFLLSSYAMVGIPSSVEYVKNAVPNKILAITDKNQDSFMANPLPKVPSHISTASRLVACLGYPVHQQARDFLLVQGSQTRP